MFNLKELYCNRCPNLINDNLIKILKCATNLELLDIYHCKKIADAVINVAVNETKTRVKYVLDIYIEGTSITLQHVRDSSRFLHIITERPYNKVSNYNMR